MTPEEAASYDDLPRTDATVTCQTPGCESNGTGIEVNILAPPHTTSIVCGACGKPITDIKTQ